ncbi:MAG: hypothetical protein GTN74_17015 [Proteobacteria bacterium]|nr:hypothetical protein [Pseudomonadota bacterium]NIS70705.1 hypothetical protein [Pseudomonadota bacterium]
METRGWTNRLTCLNCGATVHWTDFECHVCGRNPREKEPAFEICLPQKNPASQNRERRKYPRYDFQGQIVLNECFRGEFVDLCQRGAKFKTLLRLFRDEVVDLDFPIRGTRIRVKARVVHVRQGVIDERFTLGVFFESLDKGHDEILDHYLREISEDQLETRYFA